jgi:hypothetical protein
MTILRAPAAGAAEEAVGSARANARLAGVAALVGLASGKGDRDEKNEHGQCPESKNPCSFEIHRKA